MAGLFEEERLQKITEYVGKFTRVSVQQLCDIFDVSESTVRRDLKELESRGLLKRTHGGAVHIDSVAFEPSYHDKEDKYRNEKQKIAKKAAELIEDGDSLIIDSGTTTYYLADELTRFRNLRVVTNSILLAQKLSELPGVEVMSTGGILRKNTMALVGPVAEEVLEKFRADKAFIGTNGLDVKFGLTTPNIVEASIKHKMMTVSDQVIVLADHTKIGAVSFSKFGSLSDIDDCVTGNEIQQAQKNELENQGVALYFADE